MDLIELHGLTLTSMELMRVDNEGNLIKGRRRSSAEGKSPGAELLSRNIVIIDETKATQTTSAKNGICP